MSVCGRAWLPKLSDASLVERHAVRVGVAASDHCFQNGPRSIQDLIITLVSDPSTRIQHGDVQVSKSTVDHVHLRVFQPLLLLCLPRFFVTLTWPSGPPHELCAWLRALGGDDAMRVELVDLAAELET